MTLAQRIRRRCSSVAIPYELTVEHRGRPVAILSDPQFEDMFWFRWQITPLAADAPVTSDAFWADSEIPNIVFRCRRSNAVADTAFWAGANPVRDGRLILRGAYAPYEVSLRREPFLWLKLFLLGGGAHARPRRKQEQEDHDDD